MSATTHITAGFSDPVHDAQRVFRRLLEALSRPGSLASLDGTFEGLDGLEPRVPKTLAAALLTLADHETPVWLDDTVPESIATLLRFHAGAPRVVDPMHAAFAVLLDLPQVGQLDRFSWGSPEAPDRAVTVLIAVPSLRGGARVDLSGPGIEHAAQITPSGMPADFWQARRVAQSEFPCGVDAFLFDATHVIGLPRTTCASIGAH